MNRRSKFTPVELILVMSVLAALLLPALQRARESAHQSNCKGNLNQIGKALTMYSNDQAGMFPAGPTYAGGTSDTVISAGDFYGRDICYGFELLRVYDYLADYNVYVCPSSSTTEGKGTDSLRWQGNANLSYAYRAGMVAGDSVQTGRAGSGISADLTGDADITSNGGAANHIKYGNILFLSGYVQGFAGLGWFSPANAGYATYNKGTVVMTPNTLRDPVTGTL